MKLFIDKNRLNNIADRIRALRNRPSESKYSVDDLISMLEQTTSLRTAKYTQKLGLLNTTTQTIETSGTSITRGTKTITINIPSVSPDFSLDSYIIYAGAVRPGKFPIVYATTDTGTAGAHYNSQNPTALDSSLTPSTTNLSNCVETSAIGTYGGGKRFIISRSSDSACSLKLSFANVPYRTYADYGFTTQNQQICPAIFYYVFVIGPTTVSIGNVI